MTSGQAWLGGAASQAWYDDGYWYQGVVNHQTGEVGFARADEQNNSYPVAEIADTFIHEVIHLLQSNLSETQVREATAYCLSQVNLS